MAAFDGSTSVFFPKVRQTLSVGSAKVFDDLRAGVAGFAAIEDTLRRQTADVIGIHVPPKGTFTAGLVKLHHEVRLREAEVQADSARRNDRPGAVVHLAIGLILGETVVDELSYEGARLRASPSDNPSNLTGHRI